MGKINKISDIKDPIEREGRILIEQFWLITNLPFLKYIKIPINNDSIRIHNSTCEFLEYEKRFQINPETLNYYMDEETKEN